MKILLQNLATESNFNLRNEAMIREQMSFITVPLMLNQGTLPENGLFRFRGAFFGTFLAKQKSTNTKLPSLLLSTPLLHSANASLKALFLRVSINPGK